MLKAVKWSKERLLTIKGALASYLVILTGSTLTFWLIPGLLDKSVDFVGSFYFSVVTITTLGYGDILPCGNAGRLITSFVSLSGVVLLGFFLVGVANGTVRRQERLVVDAAKKDLDVQYKFYREDIALYCVFILDRSQELDPEFTDKMASADEFKEYFQKNGGQRWEIFKQKIALEPGMSAQLLRILESLELHIRQFVT